MDNQNLPKASYVIVTEDYAGQRIDNFLMGHMKGVPKTRVYKSIRKGEVRVNKGRISPDYRIQAGDSIRIPPLRMSEERPPLAYVPERVEKTLLNQILYEDDELIAINKPAGIAVHGGSGLSFGVIEALRILKPEIRQLELVHRLDRDTSGCLILAKRRSALRSLHEQLLKNEIEKYYLALVKGNWQAGKRIEAPLLKNQLKSGERIVRVDPAGKPSTTEFEVLNRYSLGNNEEKTNLNATFMQVRLITGRTHQIRVHCLHAGHPVAGDQKYGDPLFNREMKRRGMSRLFLHASKIRFKLPKSGEYFTIEAPLESALQTFLRGLH